MDTAVENGVEISPADHERVFALYDSGKYLQAYTLGSSIAPLDKWRGVGARVLAGRMAGNLGAPKLGNLHFIHAYRQDPKHPEACWFFGRYLLDCRGPWDAWKFMQRQGNLEGASDEICSYWLAMHSAVLGRLRDFDAAERWLAQAEEVGPPRPWVGLERAHL